MQSIAATTTRTGLRVHAQLDTNTYDTGVRISDRQINVLPLHRHSWHPDWNYTLFPQPFELVNTTPDPFDQPSPDLAWLQHPALTGLTDTGWDSLLTALLTLHDQQREASLHRRRGHRPRQTAPGTGRRPVLTLADRLLAATLHYRHGLPQTTIASLFTVRAETINKQLCSIRELLQRAGYTIQPSPDKDRHHRRPLPLRRRQQHHRDTQHQDSELKLCKP